MWPISPASCSGSRRGAPSELCAGGLYRGGFAGLVELAPDDWGQDAAVAVVLDLDGGVDAADGGEAQGLGAGLARGHGNLAAGLERVGELEVEGLGAVEAEGLGGLAGGEVERQDAHADQVAAVD